MASKSKSPVTRARMGPGMLVGAREAFARVHSDDSQICPVLNCQP